MIPVVDLPMHFLLPMNNLSNVDILHHMPRLDILYIITVFWASHNVLMTYNLAFIG